MVQKFLNINLLMGERIDLLPIVEGKGGVVYSIVWIDEVPINYDILVNGYARYNSKFKHAKKWYVDKEESVFWGKYLALGYVGACEHDLGIWGYKYYNKYNYFKGNAPVGDE